MSRIGITLLLLAGIMAAGTFDQTVEFAPSDLTVIEQDGYSLVSLNGALNTMEPGTPLLPLVSRNVLLPADAEITGVEVIGSRSVELDAARPVYPAQPMRPLLEGSDLPFQAPDPAIYGLNADYPGRLVDIVPSGSRSGYRVAGLLIYPVQYNPQTGRLNLYTRLDLRISYAPGVHNTRLLTNAQAKRFGADVASLVLNREQVKAFAPPSRSLDGEVDYCVITPAALVSAWEPLLGLRRRQGLNAIAMPTETIYARYTGVDNQARIRAFITDYWNNRGLKWVILGGDHALVPTRFGYLPYSTYNVPADVYYSDLDWSWDSNNNGRYGEMTGDTLDLFADLYVGRIPCDNATHIANYINKDTLYELHPDTTYLKKVLLPWEWLWQNIGHGGFLVNNNIKAIMPSDWQASVVGNATTNQTRDSLNAGQHFMHFAGHGNYNLFGSAFTSANVPSLTNVASRKLTIINSMACFCGEFDDQECLGESLVNFRGGGAVAAMLNARYGWGAPPNMGPGEHFSQEFYRNYQQHARVGVAAGLVKDWFRNVSMSQMTYRWTTYVLTSFFDPALPMWTRPPQTMLVVHPESVPGAPQTVRVLVDCGDVTVRDAQVSIMKGNTVIAAGRTNELGWIELFIYPEGGETLLVSVAARDFLPYTGTIFVQAACTAPAIGLGDVAVLDRNNGRLDPGETTDLKVALRNLGTAAATAVSGLLTTASPWVTILDSLADYGTIAPGDSADGDHYQVSVAPDCPAGTRAGFSVRARGSEGSWEPFFELVIGETPLRGACWASHDTGNFVLSVTGLGSFGSTGWRAEGVGMVYPKDYAWSASRLMLGSLMLGTDTSYVCDRFYHPNWPANDSDFVMLDSVRPILPPERADEEFRARFSDAAHRNARHLEIEQKSMTLANPALNSFCVIEYCIYNADSLPVTGLAAGLFADFKMTGWNMNDSFDRAEAESLYRMSYVYTGDTAALGLRLLSPTVLQGLSVIDGYSDIQRSGMMSNAVKDSFLWGRKQVMSGTTNRNWACMVSTGPLTILPGSVQRVAFAVVGGRSRAQLRANSDSAQAWYDRNPTAVEEPIAAQPARFALRVRPRVFRSGIDIAYSLPTSGRLTVAAYDPGGRLVAPVFSGPVSAPGSIRWQPQGLKPGVYFLKVNDATTKIVRVE